MQGLIGYYTGRALQLGGLFIMAETLIMYFGQMMPLLEGSLLGVAVFYVGYFLSRRFSVPQLREPKGNGRAENR